MRAIPGNTLIRTPWEKVGLSLPFSKGQGGGRRRRVEAADDAKVATITKDLDAKHIAGIVSITAGAESANHLVRSAMVAMPNSVVNGSGSASDNAVKALRADIKPMVSGTDLAEGVTG